MKQQERDQLLHRFSGHIDSIYGSFGELLDLINQRDDTIAYLNREAVVQRKYIDRLLDYIKEQTGQEAPFELIPDDDTRPGRG